MIGRHKRLMGHFNYSSKSNYLLCQKQLALHHKQLSLLQDVITRWNSGSTWLSAYWHSSNHFVPDLRRGDLMPTDEEFATMEILVEVMKPLVDITEALGAQQWVTASQTVEQLPEANTI